MNMSLPSILLSLLRGFLVSLELAAIVLVFGTIAGVAVGTLAAVGPRLGKIAIHVLVVIVRGVPLLIQVFAVFYFLPLIGPTFSPFVTATVALSLFATATIGEIVRGGIEAVARTQMEAARALGLSRLHALVLVIAPQALPMIIPSLVGQFVWLIKGTSIISLLGVPELMYSGHQIIERTLRGFEVMAFIWLLYTAVCYPLSAFGRYVEVRLRHGSREKASLVAALPTSGARA